MHQRHWSALKLSLFTALGLISAGCGANVRQGHDDEEQGGSAGAAGTSNGTTAGTSGSSSLSHQPSCTSPQPQGGGPGLVSCDEGYTYRSTPGTCSGIDAANPSLPRAPFRQVDCFEDSSVCDAYQYGYCEEFYQTGSYRKNCASGCASDDDCDVGLCRCEPGAKFGVCLRDDTCDSDANCSPGFHCVSTPLGCQEVGFSCQTATDACFGSLDCPAAESCVRGQNGFACGGIPACGRPFLVDAASRVPPVIERSDWTNDGSLVPMVAHLSAAERADLAAHWTELGQMEHASIAAFARFQLQLLALGAPAELVRACNQALVDETAHTQLCFALASAYAGKSVGPGPLDVSHSLDVTSLADIVELVIAEGCIGETSAALDALESAELATDPVIRDAYARIAADEQRHAELAFRFVRWALERETAVVAERIADALDAAPRSASLCEVVSPTLRALLEPRQAA